jgi:hypothetical protein
MSLEDIVRVNISTASAAPTRAGFGTGLIAACRVPWEVSNPTQRGRVYASTAGMIADGWRTSDPAYRAAATMFAQQPASRRVWVGKRALAFTQVVDLTPATPALGKVYVITIDGDVCTYTASGSDDLAAVCTAFASAINTAAADVDADAIVTSRASSASIQTLTGTDFNGVVGQGAMDPPRSPSLTLSNSTDWDATTAVFTGEDSAGNVISESLAIPNNGNTTVNGTKLFRKFTQIVIPAQTGAGGTFTVGKRARLAASGASGTKVVVTATDAGMVIPYASRSDTLALRDASADPGIATDLAAIKLAVPDWYGLLLDSNSEAEVEAAAAWAESNGKLFVPQSADTLCLDSASTTDVAADLQTANYGRTALWWHPDIGTLTSWLGAGILGNRLPADPGSDTWAYKTVAGVASYVLTETQKTNLHAKNAGTYTEIAGIDVTEQGKVAGGEWIDVVRGIDWLRARLSERIFGLLANNAKVPYTDAGVDLVKGEVFAQLRDGVTVGLFSPGTPGDPDDPPPRVSAPLVKDVPLADRQARLLPDVEFFARLAGAIHAVEVTGTVSV